MSSEPDSTTYDGNDVDGAFTLLAEMTREFADSLDIEPTLARAMSMIVTHLRAEAGSLWLLSDGENELVCRASVGPHQIAGLTLPLTQGIVGKSVRENVCQTVLDVAKDPNFSKTMDQKSGFVTRSILCAPMRVSDKPIGAIQVINKIGRGGRFSEADLLPLQVLASSAGLAVANARMAASLVEHERVQRELELAAEIQRSLLPGARASDLPVFGVNIPAREVSGDFYDFLGLPDGRIAFCLGDVAGKGMNAALLMAKTASLYRCLAKSIERPGRLLAVLNDELCETATRGMFVTMSAGIFEPKSGLLCLSNAGHEPALVRSGDGRFFSIPADAPPLGIAPGIAGECFPENDVDLDGGSLYLFSDGVTEALFPSGAALGPEGLQELVGKCAELPLEERVRAIIEEVSRLRLRDDLTLLGVSATGGDS